MLKALRQQFVMVVLVLLLLLSLSMAASASFGTIISLDSQYAIAESSSCDNTMSDEVNTSGNNNNDDDDFVHYENHNLAGGGKLVIQRPLNWTVDESYRTVPSVIFREIVHFFAPLQKQDRIITEGEDGRYDASLTIIENHYLNQNNVASLDDYLERTLNGTVDRIRGAEEISKDSFKKSLNYTFLGNPAYKVEGEIRLTSSNMPDQETIRFLQVGTIVENNTGYYVKYLAKSSEYGANLRAVEMMINSIEIHEDKANNNHVDATNNFTTYCNHDFGIEMRYPLNWSKAEIRSDANPAVFFSPKEDGEYDGWWERLELWIGYSTEGMQLHEIVRQRIDLNRQFSELHASNFRVVTLEEIGLGMAPAFMFTVEYNITNDLFEIQKIRVQEFIRIKDNIGYMLRYTADYQDYAKYSSIIKEMIDSFEVYDPSAAERKVAEQNLLQGIKVNGLPTYISINPETNRVYVASSLSNVVSVIDGNSGRILDTIEVGKRPIEIDTSSDRYMNMIYVINHRSNDISVIDGANTRVVETLSALEKPLAIKVDPNDQTLYIANASHITIINGDDYDIKKNVTLPYNPAWNATFITVDTYNDMTYVLQSCSDIFCAFNHNSTISILNASSTSNYNKEEGEIIVPGVINALGINPMKGLLYASVLSHGHIAVMNLSTIDVSTRNETININNSEFIRLVDDIDTIDFPLSLDINAKTSTIYVPIINSVNRERTGIHVINSSNNISENFIQLNGSYINSIRVDSYRNIIYAADAEKNLIYKINGTTNQLIYEVNFDIWPPDSGTMSCTVVDDIISEGDDEFSTFEVSDNTRLEFDHGTTLSCNAEPKSDYFPVRSQIEELIGVKDVRDDYGFEGFSLVGTGDLVNTTKVTIREQEPIPINGYLNLTANFKQIDPSFSPSQVQTLHGVILTAILTSSLGGGIRFYQKRKRSTMIKYSNTIDTIYKVFHEQKSDECIRNLNQIRTKLLDLLNESKISENDYTKLNGKISQYEDEIRREKNKNSG